MPRLLILCEHPTMLGGERSMLATLYQVRSSGFEVRVAAPPTGPLADALEARDVPVVAWEPRANGRRRPLDQLREELTALLDREQPDLTHANSLSTSQISGPVFATTGAVSIGHLRDIVKLSSQAVGDLNCHRRLLAVSRETRDYHLRQGLDATRCRVLYNGVDLEAFSPREPTGYLHRELGLSPAARLILSIGQIGMRKGLDVSLVAAGQIMSENADVHWLFAGQRSSAKEEAVEHERMLHEIASEPPLAGRVHFLGQRDDVAALLCECELMVHAARQEPLGRVLLEAAAAGCPIVATDVGGTIDIFPNDQSGAVLVPSDDRTLLAEAVLALLADDTRRERLGRRARERACQAFDIRSAASKLVQQYQDVLAS